MTTKLTLYSDKTLIAQVKAYAKEHNTSVSKIVNTFFTNLMHTQQEEHSKSNITDSLTGLLKGEEADTNLYHDYLEKKYL